MWVCIRQTIAVHLTWLEVPSQFQQITEKAIWSLRDQRPARKNSQILLSGKIKRFTESQQILCVERWSAVQPRFMIDDKTIFIQEIWQIAGIKLLN